ncbi:hypothetical protein AB0N14_17685 [Streptomyces sp. NPDC051104]|uniref:hypothetical protein n=1 Tax=Streptomyces sp. NPDC051104 TaxID=3155044 RepID=UPI00342126BD
MFQFQYECPNCRLVSEPYATRGRAERRGQKHRDELHDGMHPIGEAILQPEFRAPQGKEWQAVAIAAALILIALIASHL